jgi:hypothetical protein
MGDDVARRLAERLDVLERRVEELESQRSMVAAEPAKPRFDRKANNRRYQRERRARQKALRMQGQDGEIVRARDNQPCP